MIESATLNNFTVLTLSYKKAPIQVRERLSLNTEEIGILTKQLKEILGIQEALVLSTCNRTEIYYNALEGKEYHLIRLLSSLKGEKGDEIEDYFEVKKGSLAVNHLFRVALGLESQVIGDIQITNQVKQSYQIAADLEMAGPFLHRLLHTIFFANKKVVQETSFRDGAASVSYAAVEMLEEMTQHLSYLKIVVVGVGEIGTDVVRNLENIQKNKQVVIINRTFAKAEAIAKECGYTALPFEKLWEQIAEADAVISTIVTPTPYFNAENLSPLVNGKFKYLFDLSVPRSISKEVENIHGIVLYNMDDIHQRTNAALQRRKEAIPHVEAIIAEMAQEFEEWTKELIFSPTIQRMKNALEQIRQEEIARFAKQLSSDEDRKIVEHLTKNMMNKIMKMPVLQLKAACKRGEAETLVDVLNDLFNIENIKKGN